MKYGKVKNNIYECNFTLPFIFNKNKDENFIYLYDPSVKRDKKSYYCKLNIKNYTLLISPRYQIYNVIGKNKKEYILDLKYNNNNQDNIDDKNMFKTLFFKKNWNLKKKYIIQVYIIVFMCFGRSMEIPHDTFLLEFLFSHASEQKYNEMIKLRAMHYDMAKLVLPKLHALCRLDPQSPLK